MLTKICQATPYKVGFESLKPLKTPMIFGSFLSKYDGSPLTNPTLFHSIVGALQYYIVTRLEIAFFN